ncbi:MAG: metallophosphoesterase family protein [Clostridia bacterium]|nr:metallophosphoesterase family protein [Clostridia bacterium]
MKKILSLFLCFVMAFSAVFPCFIGSSAAQSVTTVAAASSDYAELELSNSALGAFVSSSSVTEVRFDDEEIVSYNRDTLGKSFTVYTKAANGLEGVSMPVGGYEAKFTAPYTGTYDFRFDIVTDIYGRGAYVQIDDGEIFHAYAQYTFGQVVNFYGFSAELTGGQEYTFKVIPNTDLGGAVGTNAYLFGFAYALKIDELEQSASALGAFANSLSITEVKFSDEDIVSYNRDTRGKSFYLYTLSANKMDAVSNPDGGYFAKFTAPYTGTYDFRLDIICDPDGRGAYVQIDDGEIYYAYTVGTFPNVINFYGFSAQLIAGQEYTLKVFPNTEYGGAAGTNAYLHGFAYALQIGEMELSDTPVGAFATSDTIGAVNLYDDEIVAYNEALLGKDIGTWSTAAGGQFDGVNIPTEGYVAEFTVPYTGAYEIRFDFVSDNSGRGAYIQIDNGQMYHAFDSHTYPYTASFYGMELNLTAGKHTFKVMREPSRSTGYIQGFAYAFAIGQMEASATPVGAFENATESSITTVNFYDADIISYNKNTLGTSFTVFDTTAGSQFNGVSMPSVNPYCAKFTVPEDGYYAFRLDFVSDNNGRGAYVQIDNGKIFDAFGIHTYPATASYYGMTVYLTAGEHTFKAYRNWKMDGTQPRSNAYIQAFAFTLSPEVEDEVDLSGYPAFTNIVLQLGADESKLNFTWFSLDEGEGTITFAKASEMVDGAFPETATVVTAARTDSVKDYYFANKATIEGLEPSTDYYYQLANGEAKSDIIPFSTGSDGAFSFAVVGDPQVGRGDNLDLDYETWGRTLNQLVTADEFASADFMLSVGDQINQFGNTFAAHEEQFDVYSNHDELLSMPTVVTLGNHDNYDHCMHSYHFNEPNLSGIGATADPVTGVANSSDYWFIYNNALFLVLNNNDFLDYSGSAASKAADKAAADAHGAFIESVMEETRDLDIDWKIVVYHRSPYGSSYHGNYTVNSDGVYNRTEQYNFVNMREYLIPYFYENGIDLVLSGHDHCYTRTHIIKPAQDENGNYIDASVITPYKDGSYTYADGSNTPTYVSWTDDTGVVHTDLKVSSVPVSVKNPDGILHVTAATASATQVNAAEHENLYTAVKATANTRQMMRIDVTETSLTLVNYNLGTGTTDEITVVDTFTINKEEETEEPVDPETGRFNLYGSSMTLGNSLSLNFFFNQSYIPADASDYYVTITKTYADGRADVTKTVPINEWATLGTVYYYVAFDGIAAKEMADEIHVQVFNGDGQAVSQVFTDSVKSYIERKFASFDAESKTWAVDCLNYGAASQVQFGYDTENLANAELTESQQQFATQSVPMTDRSDMGDKGAGASLKLESCIELVAFFKEITNTEGMYAEISFTNHYGKLITDTVTASDFMELGNFTGVSIKTMVAADVSQLITVTMYNADGTVYGIIKDSVESYAARKTTGDDLFEAVMKFGQASYNMFHEPYEAALLSAVNDSVS